MKDFRCRMEGGVTQAKGGRVIHLSRAQGRITCIPFKGNLFKFLGLHLLNIVYCLA